MSFFFLDFNWSDTCIRGLEMRRYRPGPMTPTLLPTIGGWKLSSLERILFPRLAGGGGGLFFEIAFSLACLSRYNWDAITFYFSLASLLMSIFAHRSILFTDELFFDHFIYKHYVSNHRKFFFFFL